MEPFVTIRPDSVNQDHPAILVVDDETILQETIAYNLRKEGYRVELASDGSSAIAAARTLRPDVIILDVMLPGLDGLEVCRLIRAESTVPILMLSAKSEEFDRVLGLEIGADDYLTKPFAMRELLAKVRASLRRSRMTITGRDERVDNVVRENLIRAGDIEVDPSRRQVSLDGAVLHLKPKEFDLLLYLIRHPGFVLSREALLREVWGYDYPIDTRTVDVHIRWLRQHLELDPAAPQRILTVRGYGYRFLPTADA
jgi:two-component system OmpR family response regulator